MGLSLTKPEPHPNKIRADLMDESNLAINQPQFSIKQISPNQLRIFPINSTDEFYIPDSLVEISSSKREQIEGLEKQRSPLTSQIKPEEKRKVDAFLNEELPRNQKVQEKQQDKQLKEEQKVQQEQKSKQEENKNMDDFLNQEVPIYYLAMTTSKFQCQLPSLKEEEQKVQEKHKNKQVNEIKRECFARGELIGQFYILQDQSYFRNVLFVGQFEGVFEKIDEQDGSIYFQGKITQFRLIGRKPQGKDVEEEEKRIEKEVIEIETSFNGFFKGNFYYWPDLQNIHSLRDLQKKRLLQKMEQSSQIGQEMLKTLIDPPARWENGEYYLPTLVRFEVQEIKEINLQKSEAVMGGTFLLDIKYCEKVDGLVKKSVNIMKDKKKDGGNQREQVNFESALKIHLDFQRDSPIELDLYHQLEGSHYIQDEEEWSIQDEKQDVQFQDDTKNKWYRFRIWKQFTAEIDNSYGSFFAPFNLNVLRIVLTLHHFEAITQSQNKKIAKVKMNLVGVDVQDNSSSYDPFKVVSELSDSNARNRLSKINRIMCNNSGYFSIADNRLTLFPHFRNVLINKNTANETQGWKYGLTDKTHLLYHQQPIVRTPSSSFQYFTSNKDQKVETFAFQKWQYVLVEVPIFKYVVIDMLIIFVPLFLLSIISLLIFNQANGVSSTSGYTTLAYRLVSISALMIAYVSLVPVIRENLPPMPGVTLVQIVTYICVVPNFLSLLSSMLFYTTSSQEWESTYKLFKDWVFLVAIGTSLFCLAILVIIFVVYILKDYSLNKAIMPKVGHRRNWEYQWRAPAYLDFIAKIRKNRKEYSVQQIK